MNMKRTFIFALIAGLFVTACNDVDIIEQNGVETDSADLFIPEDAEEGELLIKFVPEMTDILDQIAEEVSSGQTMTRSGIPSTDEVLRLLGGYELERVFPVDPRHEERARANGMHLWYIVRFDKNTDLKVAIRSLKLLGEVSKIQCNTKLKRVDNPSRKPIAISSERLRSASRTTDARFFDLGLQYQWGRKDPFGVEKSTGSFGSVERLSIEDAILNPTVIASGTGLSDKGGLWDTQKSIYDPCPAGWRVPDGGKDGIWAKALGKQSFFKYDSYDETNIGANLYHKLSDDLCVWYSSGSYWAVNYESEEAAFAFQIDYQYIYPISSSFKSYARYVRCMKE